MLPIALLSKKNLTSRLALRPRAALTPERRAATFRTF
jgi:hypothetical protein